MWLGSNSHAVSAHIQLEDMVLVFAGVSTSNPNIPENPRQQVTVVTQKCREGLCHLHGAGITSLHHYAQLSVSRFQGMNSALILTSRGVAN